MFINKLNQLYKPKRLLYYFDATEEEIRNLYRGNVSEKISRYANAFGTYDAPGVFHVASIKKEVIGIEFRMEDERIQYPKDLQSVVLDAAFFYSVEIDYDPGISFESVNNLFEKITKDGDAHRNYSNLAIQQKPGLIGIFSSDGKIRILYECNLTKDIISGVKENENEKEMFDKEMLYQMAFFDPITNHYNWNHLILYLEMPMDWGIGDYAFVHFDIKEFRVINELYGHNVGNKVLQNVVSAMNRADFVYASARCHNDNFAMIIKDMPEEETMEKLRIFFEDLSYLEEDENYRIYYRCGVVLMQLAMLSGNRVADAGKYAQALGINHNQTDITIYTDRMHDNILWGNYIKAYIDKAIEKDELKVYLQPKFNVESETLKGAEALIRWNFKGKEMLPPYRFVPYFEKDGSIGKVDDLVLRKVCKMLKRRYDDKKPIFPVSVNLSRSRLYDVNLVNRLTGIVDEIGLEHKWIDFELTESASYDNKEQMLRVLYDLKERGFKISMDDFGTGYSSLSLLTEMPLDTLKIDKSFVDKIGVAGEKPDDIIVIEHIISLAKKLNIVCLAEGAENKSQVDRLRELGCEIIQGYYYGKPVSIPEFERLFLRE